MNKKQFLKLIKKRGKNNLGHIIFSFAILLIIIFSLSDPTRVSVNKAIFLLVLGLIVGLIDVPKKVANSFIIATIAIVMTSMVQFEQITYKIIGTPHSVGIYLKGILLNSSIFLGLAMLIVALKIIYRVYKE